MTSAALADELLRALHARSGALAEQVADLQGMTPRSRHALQHLLGLLAYFPQALEATLAVEWERNEHPAARIAIVQSLQQHTTMVERFVEQWVSGAVQTEQDASLLRAVERECAALDVGAREPVISPGEPDNFVTLVSDIEQSILGPVGPPAGPAVPDGVVGRQYVLVQVPRFEGYQALWRPVIVGHELAHLAVIRHGLVDRFDLSGRFDWDEATRVGAPPGRGPSELRLLEIGRRWLSELLCDAYAYRRFGPAAVAALSEFLTVVGATGKESLSHPPGWLRVRLLTQWLASDGSAAARLAHVTDPWNEVGSGPTPTFTPWVRFLAAQLEPAAEDCLALVENFGDRYDASSRSEPILQVADRLAEGIPGQEVVATHDGVEAVRDEDVVNAAWVARAEDSPAPVGRLALKCLDTLEFVRQWSAAGGQLAVLEPEQEPEAATFGGVLSARRIAERLGRTDDARLVVTPLLEGGLEGASLDVRLGNRFVFFRRSRTATFDPLAEGDDPRSMQGRLTWAWGERIVLHPGELVLATTLEYVVLPSDLTAQVVTRSSYGRLGLITATAVQVHPHFRGCLTLELVNVGTVPIELIPGERIAQLVFQTIDPVDEVPTKYHCPIEPEFSKVRDDVESEVLRELRRGSDRGVEGG